MYLKELNIEGYKGFRDSFSISLQKGLNVIVGDNASGKTGIIDALRLLLKEDEFGHSRITESDFYRPFDSKKSKEFFRLKAKFDDLSETEHVAFLPWSSINGTASLTLHVENKQNHRGRYKPVLWGGASRASMFDGELFDVINCVYLPPLRDAEARLSAGKSSRLARLLKNLQYKAIQEAKQNGEQHLLEKEVQRFNEKLSQNKAIDHANDLIQKRLTEAIGSVLGQKTQIQFSEVSFNRIVENLRLLFFPDIKTDLSPEDFRTLDQNSLGYNNLLYLATVLAELTEEPTETSEKTSYLRILLIEEPEAHLNPQLQIRLLKYLDKTAKEKNVQVIITTHSPVLASSVPLDTVTQLCVVGNNKTPRATALRSCNFIKPNSKAFLNRWLNATKSILLFARGIILVEGISEAMLLPELAKIVLSDYPKLPDTLEDAGVSVINMNGIYFQHFMPLFAKELGSRPDSHENIPLRCAGITDKDPPKEKLSTPSNCDSMNGENPALKLKDTINQSMWARLYSSPFKTFEYDLAMEGNNLTILSRAASSLIETNGKIKSTFEEYSDKNKNWATESEENKVNASMYLLKHINKGEFAQALASELEKSKSNQAIISIPDYIHKAIIWACGGGSNPDES